MPDQNTSLLAKLVNQQLSSVTFVQDYPQLDFDGLRLTLNEWPIIELGHGERLLYGDSGYRDRLCFFIARIVERVDETATEISIDFAEGRLRLDLSSPDEPIHKVIFHDTNANTWGWWEASWGDPDDGE